MENWITICIIALLVIVGLVMLFNFILLPSNKQQEKIHQWLLWAVVEAERYLESGTGQLKLVYVYDKFKKQYPLFATFMPYLTFEKMVEAALEEMHYLIATNPAVEDFVSPKLLEGEWLGGQQND